MQNDFLRGVRRRMRKLNPLRRIDRRLSRLESKLREIREGEEFAATVAKRLGVQQELLRDLNPAYISIKTLGYEMGRALAQHLPVVTLPEPPATSLLSKPCQQQDFETLWLRYWAGEMRLPIYFHRKLWEYAYVLQALHEHGAIAPGLRGIGFGCGEEPIPSLLAARGADIVVTDLPPDEAVQRGWATTGQHAGHLDRIYRADLCDRASFDRHVSLEWVDMTDIPRRFAAQFDFCWSACALEHLGSLDAGLQFVIAAAKVLKPGGVMVHTTEYNFGVEEKTLETGPVVLYRRSHFEALARQLTSEGLNVSALDFDLGNKPLDQFIDLPPYGWAGSELPFNMYSNAHLRFAFQGFPYTSIGIIARRPA